MTVVQELHLLLLQVDRVDLRPVSVRRLIVFLDDDLVVRTPHTLMKMLVPATTAAAAGGGLVQPHLRFLLPHLVPGMGGAKPSLLLY